MKATQLLCNLGQSIWLDFLQPIHDRTNTVDGWVSLEVSPLLAYDTEKSLRAAKELFSRAACRNLLITIPGTHEGLPAIEEAIFSGIPVNVTLLFSPEQYLAAADALLRGNERRLESGLGPSVGSVASVFVSRWDAAVRNQIPTRLHNQLGGAVAKRTNKRARRLLTSPIGSKFTMRGRVQSASYGLARAPRIHPPPTSCM